MQEQEQEQKLRNIMEILVEEKYQEMKDALNICKCEKCKLDIMSYVLNRLPAKYVVTDVGAAITKLAGMEPQFNMDIMKLLAQAAQVIGKNPRH